MKRKILQAVFAIVTCACANAQVNSGSNGSDGAFNPATNTVINMADHANGIYQYTSVNIPTNVTVTFIPNANNTPVVWLVQSNVIINGTVDVSGQNANNLIVGAGGPSGGAGGAGGTVASSGLGLGGGGPNEIGGGGSFGTAGGGDTNGAKGLAGQIYGNSFLTPLIGGSGGGGSRGFLYYGWPSSSGGGGGGAMLIASSLKIFINGQIFSVGGNSGAESGGGGSGGGIRLVTGILNGTGYINVSGGSGGGSLGNGGFGRVRLDFIQSSFAGQINGLFTQGFQPIIIPTSGQGVQLSIASVAGASISSTPNGQLVSPDAIISGQQLNPVSIVVNCVNLPLNAPVTVTVKPANGASISAVGLNSTGTLAASTATVSLSMPRGGGLIYATAATGN